MSRCDACAFYEQDSGLNGYCKRYPPTQDRKRLFPPSVRVRSSDWCGEWEQKAKPSHDRTPLGAKDLTVGEGC